MSYASVFTDIVLWNTHVGDPAERFDEIHRFAARTFAASVSCLAPLDVDGRCDVYNRILKDLSI